MKKIIFTLIMVVFVAFNYAHPPKKVKLFYDKVGKTLQINITHKVSNSQTHYIDKITIFVNGVQKEIVTLNKQTDINGETYSYSLALNEKDKVQVTASCNKMGSKSARLTIQ